MSQGYIKIHRKFKEWYGFSSSKRVHLWITLLLEANHKDNTFLFNGKPTTVKKGQLITGRKSLSTKTKISESYIEDLLTEFEKQGQIQQQKTNTNRLITIVNWDEYQICDNGEDNKKTTERQRSDTNNNDNNEKKEYIERNGLTKTGRTDIQEVVEYFKTKKGFSNQPDWDKYHFKRHVKAASDLFNMAKEEWKEAIDWVSQQGYADWTLETVKKKIPDYRQAKSRLRPFGAAGRVL